MLARNRYCPQLTDAGLTEVGIYRDARLVWIVMAAPFAPSVGYPRKSQGSVCWNSSTRLAPRRATVATGHSMRRGRFDGTTCLPSLAAALRGHGALQLLQPQCRDGSDPAQRVERAGYRYRATGENIAAGQMKPEEAVAGWIKSPQHCAT